MKTKQLERKLTLSKKTIANLIDKEMNVIYGGESEVPCPTFVLSVCHTKCVITCITPTCSPTCPNVC